MKNLFSKRKSGFLYVVTGILALMVSLPSSAQNTITVTGKITDSANEPLIGASVLVNGTTNGVIADLDGNYSISVAPDASLTYGFMGYESQTVSVSGRNVINVSLKEDALTLQEVVAIGYGSQRKQDLSMAVSSLDVDASIKGHASTLEQAIQGRMAGVTIQDSGDPMKPSTFIIRGRGSKGNPQASSEDENAGAGVLVIVDGIPNAPYSVEDIETITVLKDAASASIYGASVGTGGVVIITTKKAQTGKVKLSLSASNGFKKATNLPSVLDAQQFCDVWAQAVNQTSTPLPGSADPTTYKFANVTRTNWFDEIFRVAHQQHYSISASGGSERFSAIASATFNKNEGVLLNTFSKDFTGKLAATFKVTDWMSLSERVTVSLSDGQGNVNTSHQGPIIAALWYPRSATVYETDENGEFVLNGKGEKIFGGTSPSWAGVSGTPLIFNPVAELTRLNQKNPVTKVFSTTTLEIKPISWLTLKSDFTADLRHKEKDIFYAKMTEAGLTRAENSRDMYNDNYRHWLSETTLTFAQVFGKHHVSAMAGFSADSFTDQYYTYYTKNYNSEDPNQILLPNATNFSYRAPTETKFTQTMTSFIGRVGYSYDDRYFLVASIRRDASSKLKNSIQNFGWFPAVSGSWKISSEKFFKNSGLSNVVSFAKLRAGWGKVGSVDSYDAVAVQLLQYPNPIIFGQNLDQARYGTYLNTLENKNARWETTVQTSAGIDVNFFKNALEISVDWYDKKTKDLVDFVPTSPQIGVAEPPIGNMGTVLNTGWEVAIAYNGATANREFTYRIWGNYAFNHNEVLDYGAQSLIEHTNTNVDSKNLLYSAAGYPWFSYYLYQADGIFRSQEEIDNYTWKHPIVGLSKKIQPDAKPGDIKWVDVNNDGQITEADRTFCGSYSPKHTFSLGANLSWKGFDLSLQLQGVAGNYIYNGMKQLGMTARYDYGNLLSDVLDCYEFNPDSSKYPRLGIVSDTNFNYNRLSTFFLEKGDYLRLKNITLGYTFPKFCKTISDLRIYATVDNVFTLTNYSGVDPECGNWGVDRAVYPVTRFFNFGVNLNF